LARRGIDAARYEWQRIARPNQLPPDGDWRGWLLLAGRGFGKTRTGAEWVRSQIKSGKRRIALVAPTAADARDVMVEGESGLLSVFPQRERPVYKAALRRVVWPNGALATLFSADEPDRLRGPQHDGAWCDELGSWRYPEAWDMLMFGLRLGVNPRVVITTTPRPTKLIRELAMDAGIVKTYGTTYDNRDNLAPTFFSQIVAKYEGTRLGRQELEAALLEDVPGALWNHGMIDSARVRALPAFQRIVVAVDPAVTSGENADETGIIVVGKDLAGDGYVLADRTGRYSPIEWAQRAISAYHEFKSDRIVAEVNNGGEMVEATLRMVDKDIPFTAVHASRGKVVRAEPIAALYEQGRVHHLGAFAALEDQMCSFTTDFDRKRMGYSPDRVDALVWGLTELMVERVPFEALLELYERQAAEAKTRQEDERPARGGLIGNFPISLRPGWR